MTDFHPVQSARHPRDPNFIAYLPAVVTLKAYEVYRAIYGEQRALIEGECRGGFGVGEVIAFLYAATFPRHEWARRVDEALERRKAPTGGTNG